MTCTFDLVDSVIKRAQAGKLRLVIEKEHDYVFKQAGKIVAKITKKETCIFVDGIAYQANGEVAKQFWKYTRSEFGHTIDGLV